MIRIIVLAALIGLVWYGYDKIKSLPAAQRRGMWWKIALVALVGISLIAVATGRLHWLGGLLAVLLAVLKFGAHALFRLWPLLRATGRDAVFRTEYLEVRFLVRSSRLQGTVVRGPHQGEALESMSAETLQELADHYRERDKKSYYLVSVFLQRAGRAEDQTQGQQTTSGGFSSAPTRDEALLILGLSGNPSREEIVAAHRKLIQKLHPDRGGNDYLAARINQAKDVLLG